MPHARHKSTKFILSSACAVQKHQPIVTMKFVLVAVAALFSSASAFAPSCGLRPTVALNGVPGAAASVEEDIEKTLAIIMENMSDDDEGIDDSEE